MDGKFREILITMGMGWPDSCEKWKLRALRLRRYIQKV